GRDIGDPRLGGSAVWKRRLQCFFGYLTEVKSATKLPASELYSRHIPCSSKGPKNFTFFLQRGNSGSLWAVVYSPDAARGKRCAEKLEKSQRRNRPGGQPRRGVRQ